LIDTDNLLKLQTMCHHQNCQPLEWHYTPLVSAGHHLKVTYPSPSTLFLENISCTFNAKTCVDGFSSRVSFKQATAHLANCSPSYKINLNQLSTAHSFQTYSAITGQSDNSLHFILHYFCIIILPAPRSIQVELHMMVPIVSLIT